MKNDSFTGELELLSFGARDVWHRGPDPPCLRPDGITDERGTPRGLVGPPRRYLRPDDVRDNWDVPAGGAGEVVGAPRERPAGAKGRAMQSPKQGKEMGEAYDPPPCNRSQTGS